MDIRRSCADVTMQWDQAGDLSSNVKWYWAPPGAKVFPGWHRFTSEIYDPVHWWNDGAGEPDNLPQTWSGGALPGPFKGQSVCGPVDWFLNGAPSNAPPLERNASGLPVCCFGRGAYDDAYSDAWDTFRGTSGS